MYINVSTLTTLPAPDILIFIKSLFLIFMALKVVEVFAHRIRKNCRIDTFKNQAP